MKKRRLCMLGLSLVMLLLSACASKKEEPLTFEKLEKLSAFVKENEDLRMLESTGDDFYFVKESDQRSLLKKTEQVWRYDVEKDQLEELTIGDGQSQISSVYEYGDRLYYVKNKQEYNETTYPITITVHAMSDGKEQELQRFTTWERYRSPILVGEKEHCYLWLAAITQPLWENGEASEKRLLYRCQNDHLQPLYEKEIVLAKDSVAAESSLQLEQNAAETIAVNADGVYYRMLIDEQQGGAGAIGYVKHDSTQSSLFRLQPYVREELDATDKMLLLQYGSSENLSIMLNAKMDEMEEYHFAELDGYCGKELTALKDGLLAVGLAQGTQFYELQEQDLSKIETDFTDQIKTYHGNGTYLLVEGQNGDFYLVRRA